jgi:hypothetical protein
MPNDQYEAGKPWICPGCSRQFQFSGTYGNVVTWGTIGLTLAASYALGLRGVWLVVLATLLWFPALFLCTAMLDHLAPPRLKPFQPKPTGRPKKSDNSTSRGSGLDLFHR